MSETTNKRREEVRQRLALSLARRAAGESEWSVESNASADDSPRGISVIVTLFNYGRFVSQCLASVVHSDPVAGGVEIIVVDDASTDDSCNRVATVASALPVPVKIVRKRSNTGLADARNVGVKVATGDLVLTLDADNWLYPRCLAELAKALEDSSIAAAYPTLERVDSDSGSFHGLLSDRAWNVRDLVRGPYIDALGLFRRDVLLEIDGYSTDLIDHGWFGWEDYDLWLKLADAGHVCVHVPQRLAAYRIHAGAMIHDTNRDVVALARYLSQKFQRLANRYPDLDRTFGYVPSARVALPSAGGSRWRRCDSRAIPGSREEIRAIVTVRNELARLPHMLEQHRRLGVDRFLVVDNDSTDGSNEYLVTQPDVHLFWTDADYQAARCGVDWIERLLDDFGRDRWCLLIDADELLVYEGCEVRSLRTLCGSLETRGVNCLPTMFLDLYSDQPIVQTQIDGAESLLDRCRFFDPTGYHHLPSRRPYPRVFGGVRARLFWPEINLANDIDQLMRAARGEPLQASWPEARYLQSYPDVRAAVAAGQFESGLEHYRRHGHMESRMLRPWPPCLSQVPLVRWQRGMRHHMGRHELDGAIWQRADAVGGALLHFRLMSDTVPRAHQAARKAEGTTEPRIWREENERYAEVLTRQPLMSAMSEISMEYLGPEQLVRLGLLAEI